MVYVTNYLSFFYLFFGSFILVLLLIIASFEHFLIVLIFLDLLLLINILMLVFYTSLFGDSLGYIYALLLLGVAATDTALGLGLFILYFKATGKTAIS
jgi:NADH:ubiquinone oxidoreductase subunit K